MLRPQEGMNILGKKQTNKNSSAKVLRQEQATRPREQMETVPALVMGRVSAVF